MLQFGKVSTFWCPKNNIVGILEFRNSADPTLEMSEELEQMLKTSANFCHTF